MATEGQGDSSMSDDKPTASSVAGWDDERSASIITEVTLDDVLLGRGNGVKSWAGNLRYRELIRSNASNYVACEDRGQKDVIAHRVIIQIERPGGRFLKQLSYEIEGSLMGATWEKIPRDAALAKVRQALRDMAQLVDTAEMKGDSEGDDNYNYLTNESMQDLIDEEERINELLQLVQVYRENSSMRCNRLHDLISSLEAQRNMTMSSPPQSRLQQDFHSFPSRKRSFDQTGPSFLTNSSDLVLDGESVRPRGSQLDGSRGIGQFKTDDSRNLFARSPNPSNLTGMLGVVPRGVDRLQLLQNRHTSETSPSRMSYQPSFSATEGGGDNRDRLLLGEMLADHLPRFSVLPGVSLDVDHGRSMLQLSARARSGQQRGLRQPNSAAVASSLLQYSQHHQSDSESSSSQVKNH